MAFPYGSPLPNNTVNNVAKATGQTITLPAGKYAALHFTATAAAANNTAQMDQQFTITYTSGASQTFKRSFSDWLMSGSATLQPNEARAESMGSIVTSNGTTVSVVTQNNSVYGYSVGLDASRTVESITLPNNANVKLLGLNLTPASLPVATATPTQVNLTAYFNKAGAITPNNTPFATSAGIEDSAGSSKALSGPALYDSGTTVNWASKNVTFNLAPQSATALNAISGSRVVPLPLGDYTKVHVLATTAWNPYTLPFQLKYMDDTTESFTRSFSVWTSTATPPADEEVVKQMSTRNLHTGAAQATQVRVYGYTLLISAGKQVKEITTPAQGKIHVLAITVT